MTRCASVCDGNRCTRPAGHKGSHYALEPSEGWADASKPKPVPDRAAKMQAVAEQWEAARGALRVGWDVASSRWGANIALLLAADAGLTPDEMRELAGRLRP